MRKGLLIYNSLSGSQAVPKALDDLLAYGVKRGLLLMPARLTGNAELQEFLLDLIREPWVEFVIACGGDGTLGGIAQLILENRPELPMGIIPAGTCNDFAESLHLPADPFDCLDVVADGFSLGLDVGRVNGERIFLSTCAAGMFVNISFTTSSQLKKSLGPLAYYFSALGELHKISSFPLRIETESEVIEDDFLLFLLINGSQAAGFAKLYSKARMHDGLMDLLLIRDVPRFELPNLLIELLNRESGDGKFFRHIRASRFSFTTTADLLTTQDGERGLPLPLSVEVLPCALKVFIRDPESQPPAPRRLPPEVVGLNMFRGNEFRER